MSKTAAVIVNPASGKTRAARIAEELSSLLSARGITPEILHTSAAGDAFEFSRSRVSHDLLYAVGGDGTLNEVVSGVYKSQGAATIVPVPAGTANVVSKELNLPQNLEELVDLSLRDCGRNFDLISTEFPAADRRRLCLMCAGIGFDADIVRRVSQRRTEKGISFATYILPILESLFSYSFPRLAIKIDEQEVAEGCTFLIIGNMLRYGGPFRIFPSADPRDGELEICCMFGKSKLNFIRYGFASLLGIMPRQSGVKYFRGRKIEITCASGVSVQMDGDYFGDLPVKFEILPAATRLCAR